MAEPYLAEIRIFSFAYAPKGWALCNGASLPVNQNAALYSLLGVQFGGTPGTTFNLPDLQGRAPMHRSAITPVIPQGTKDGVEAVALTLPQLPAHTHGVQVSSNAATTSDNTNAVYAQVAATSGSGDTPQNLYGPATALVAMNPSTITTVGGTAPHSNIQPCLVVNFCIATTGYYPQRP